MKTYNHGYTIDMKTAISIPDQIFKKVESLAHKLGMSRSELFTTAISKFIEERDEQMIISRLNAVYADQSSALDKDLYALQYHSVKLDDEKW